MVPLRVADTHRHVVEEAKAHRGIAFCMVSGWAHWTERARHFAGYHQVRGQHRRAGGMSSG